MIRYWMSVFLCIGTIAHGKWPDNAKPFARAILSPSGGSRAHGTVDFALLSQSILVKAYLDDLGMGVHHFQIRDRGHCDKLEGTTLSWTSGELKVSRQGRAVLEVALSVPPATERSKSKNIIGKLLVVRDGEDRPIACGNIFRTDNLAE